MSRDAFGVSKSSQSAAVKTQRLIMRLKAKGDVWRSDSSNTLTTGDELTEKILTLKPVKAHKKGSKPVPNPVGRAREYLRGSKGRPGAEDPAFVESPSSRKTGLKRRAEAERTKRIVQSQGDQRRALGRDIAGVRDSTPTERMMSDRPLKSPPRTSRHGPPASVPIGRSNRRVRPK